MAVTQKQLREREQAIVEEHRVIYGTVDTKAAYDLITADRLERWAAFVKDLKVPKALKKWAAMMEAVHGPEVMLHDVRKHAGLCGYKVDFITALLVVMYGEAEYSWPEELGDDDLKRAYAWMNGKKVPGVCTHLPKEA